MPGKIMLPQTHVVSKPYATAKDVQGRTIFCETCKRVIPTPRWNEHERSKKHRQVVKDSMTAELEIALKAKRTDSWIDDNTDSGVGVAAAGNGAGDWAISDDVGGGLATDGAADTGNEWTAKTTDAGEWGPSGNDGAADTGLGGGDGNDGFTTVGGRGGCSGGGRGAGRSGGGGGGNDSNCYKCHMRKFSFSLRD
jgi:hypothetical protein